MGTVENAGDFGDGGGIGSDLCFFDAIEGFGADAGAARDFGLRQPEGPAALDEFAGQADAEGLSGVTKKTANRLSPETVARVFQETLPGGR